MALHSEISYNYISGNIEYGIFNGYQQVIVNAKNNYWGSDLGPTYFTDL